MGSPRKIRRKYQKPSHPWQKARIDEEREFINEYGFKNKKEIWRMVSMLRRFKQRIKRSAAAHTEQSEKEKGQLLKKLQDFGLTKGLASADEILELAPKDIMERRLQTLVFRKGMARSIDQARQFITHRHIVVADRKITSPSYMVRKDEEDKIGFVAKSGLSSPDHPERAVAKKEIKAVSDESKGKAAVEKTGGE